MSEDLTRHPRLPRPLRIGMLAPIAWRVPPKAYGPWERVVSLLTEGLVAAGVEVTLFATRDAETAATLDAIVPSPYEETPGMDVKVWEGLHLANAFGKASRFDLVHNHYDFLPLTYASLVATPMVTTIHGLSSAAILPVYRHFAGRAAYVSISDADRHPDLPYIATVHHGIDLGEFELGSGSGGYLVFFGRIHPDKGTADAIRVARAAGLPLIVAGIVQDRDYFEREIEPLLGPDARFVGPVDAEGRNALLGGAIGLLHLVHFDEPFGLSVVEAMACGTPVLAYRRGSMPEIVVQGAGGFLVDRESEAIDAATRLAALDRSTVRRNAERFALERMVQGYLGVYRQLLQTRLQGEREAVNF